MAKPKLPKFKNPPVVEAFCGVYFQDLIGMNAPHLGALWNFLKRDFPYTETHLPLPPVSLSYLSPQIFIQAGAPNLSRTWFISKDRTTLIQIQRDRLIFNWRKEPEENSYPSYSVLKRKFKKIFLLFLKFIDQAELGNLHVTGIEFGYVNIMPLINELDSTNEVSTIFPIISLEKTNHPVLCAMSAINWHTRFDLPNREGHLHTALQSTQRNTDGQPVLRLDLTARWLAPKIHVEGIWPWLDTAHGYAVTAFASLTSQQKHAEWERWQ